MSTSSDSVRVSGVSLSFCLPEVSLYHSQTPLYVPYAETAYVSHLTDCIPCQLYFCAVLGSLCALAPVKIPNTSTWPTTDHSKVDIFLSADFPFYY